MDRVRKARMVALGKNLRAARKKANFTLGGVERMTQGEYKASAVGSYERGEREIPVTKMFEMCDLYGVSAVDVIYGYDRYAGRSPLISDHEEGHQTTGGRDMQA